MTLPFHRYVIWICYAAVTILVIVNLNHIFFWDTIQFASRHAHWYFENNFNNLLLPDSIDSGHPPGFGMFIALIWKIFGKSLAVSHLTMLPFIYLSIRWANDIGTILTNKEFGVFFPVILLANTMYLGHSVLVSPDILLICFFLGLYKSKLTQRKGLKALMVLLMGIISLRGMMIAFAFYIFDLISLRNKGKLNLKNAFHAILPYLPGGLIGISFLLFHYFSKSWLVYHEGSPWMESFSGVSLIEGLKNVIIMIWRFLDFGFIFIWIGIIYIALKNSFSLIRNQKNAVILTLVLFIFTAFPLLFYEALSGHRYLLPLYILISFIFLVLVYQSFMPSIKRKYLLMFVLIGMISGHLWVYPDKISQGWDVTLAHTPYYLLRENVKDFMHKEGIDEMQVGTRFPAKSENKYLYLNDDISGFKDADLDVDEYVLYSNIFNDFTDMEYDNLKRNWNEIYNEEIRFVHFKLYKRK